MTIAFPCENCGHRFEVDGSLAGKKCRCKKCGHTFKIPVPRTSGVGQSSSDQRTLKTFASDGPGASAPRQASAPPRPSAPKPSRLDPRRPEPAPAPEPVPGLWDDLENPYSIKGPAASRANALDDEEFLPRGALKPVTTSSSKKKKKKTHSSWMGDLPSWLPLALLGAYALLFALSFASASIAMVFIVLTGLIVVALYLIGGIGMLVTPFRESVACGLMYLFLPFYGLYYLVSRWDAMKRWFLTSLAGLAMAIFMGVCIPMMAHRPAGGPGQPNPGGGIFGALTGPAQQSQEEQMILEVIANAEEQCRILDTCNDEATAQRVAPRYGQLTRRNQVLSEELQRREKTGELGKFKDLALGLKHRKTLDDVSARLASRAEQLKTRPAIQVYFARAMAEGPDIGGPPPGFAQSGPPPGFGQNAPPPGPGAPAGFQPAGAGNPPPPPAQTPETVAGFLEGLESQDVNCRKQALGRLKDTPVQASTQVEVCKAIVPLIKDPDRWTRIDAAKALAVWGGPDSSEALRDALKDPDIFVRGEALNAIKALRDASAAEAVAALLTDHGQRGPAIEALKAMGPKAEPALIPFLSHEDSFLRADVCKALQTVGTPECVPYLYDIIRRTNNFGFDAAAAQEALKRLDPDGRGLRAYRSKMAKDAKAARDGRMKGNVGVKPSKP